MRRDRHIHEGLGSSPSLPTKWAGRMTGGTAKYMEQCEILLFLI